METCTTVNPTKTPRVTCGDWQEPEPPRNSALLIIARGTRGTLAAWLSLGLSVSVTLSLVSRESRRSSRARAHSPRRVAARAAHLARALSASAGRPATAQTRRVRAPSHPQNSHATTHDRKRGCARPAHTAYTQWAREREHAVERKWYTRGIGRHLAAHRERHASPHCASRVLDVEELFEALEESGLA